MLQPVKESVGKISLCTSPCSPCLRGASFLKQFQHGDTETTESTRRSSIFPTDCFRRFSGKSSRDAMFIEESRPSPWEPTYGGKLFGCAPSGASRSQFGLVFYKHFATTRFF